MAHRNELNQRLREIKATLINRLAARALNRRTTGLDGIAKRLLAAQPVPVVAHDPELEHLDDDWYVPGPSAERD